MATPTPQTFPQKILAARAGRPVATGERVEVGPDVALSHDDTGDIARLWATGGAERIADPDLHVVVLDHCAPAPGADCAREHAAIRAFVEAQGVEAFHDVNAGIRHQVLAEQGHALPGRLVFGSDPHVTAAGALGALALDVGRDGLASVMGTGRATVAVPGVIRALAGGRLAAGVTAMDLALRVLGALGRDGAREAGLEFAGETVETLDVPGRLTLCGVAAETGAAAAWVEPDAATLAWLNGRARGAFEIVRGDPAAPVARTLAFDAAALGPQVAAPDGGVTALADAGPQPVHVVVVGGCANGRLPDLRAAAAVLRGRRVAPATRLLVVPASQETARAAAADGTLLALLDSGAIVMNPGCGICDAPHAELSAPAEVALSTTGGRAFRGTDGGGAATWLASALTCAASAVAGRLADAREFVDEDTLRAATDVAAPGGMTAAG